MSDHKWDAVSDHNALRIVGATSGSEPHWQESALTTVEGVAQALTELSEEIVTTAEAAQVASAYTRLKRVEDRLPKVSCWTVRESRETYKSIIGDPRPWSGHATKDLADGWVAYWDAWCGYLRKWVVEPGVVGIYNYYGEADAPASAPPERTR